MKKLVVLCLLLASLTSYSKDIKVTFINPSKEGNLFWDKVVNYMKIAADELEIELNVVYPSENHRLKVKEAAMKELEQSDKPDYLLYQYSSQTSKVILKEAESKNIYSFIFNSDVSHEEKNIVGNVNEKYDYWIGHVFPNDFAAGYKLGKSLIDEAKKKNLRAADGKIHVIGLSGSHDSNVAVDRNNGLRKAVDEEKDVVLHQILFVQWRTENAYTQTLNIFKRYPNTSVIWNASDSMALGAIKAIEELDKVPGQEVLVGGIDWSKEGLEAVRDGEMLSTVGGHFLEGVTSLMLIKDHSEGVELNVGNYPVKTEMEIINKENIDHFEKLLSYNEFEKIDIKNLTKSYNKDLDKFNFNLLEEIIKK